MRPNPKLKIAAAITELGVGEALVSLLDEKGRPGVTERALIVPPASQLGPITEQERAEIIRSSGLGGTYDRPVDRESAYEKLKQRTEETLPEKAKSPGRQPQTILDAMTKSAARAIGSELGRRILRGALGSILGTTRR